MSELMNASAGSLMREPGRAKLNRVIQAYERNSPGLSYIDAYRQLSTAMDGLGGGVSVGEALQAAGFRNLDAVAQDLTTVERADAAKQAIHQKALGLHQLDASTSGTASPSAGLAKIDAATYADVMGAQPVHWARLHEARRLPGGEEFQGPHGQDRFAHQDRETADAGFDMVATRHRAAAAQAARSQTVNAIQKLDAALAQGKTPGERRRLLDAAASEELRQLDAISPVSGSAPPGSSAPVPGPLRMLDGESRVEYARRLQALIDSGEDL
jgi:hypothetical protein